MSDNWGFVLWLILGLFIVIMVWIIPNSKEVWVECWIIATKMDILTDNWTGEYKRLSDKFLENWCKPIDVLDIRDM